MSTSKVQDVVPGVSLLHVGHDVTHAQLLRNPVLDLHVLTQGDQLLDVGHSLGSLLRQLLEPGTIDRLIDKLCRILC